MNFTDLWPMDALDIASHLQTELDVELAFVEQQREWETHLATLNSKAKYRAKNTAVLRHKQAMRRARAKNAVMPWLTKIQERQIQFKYERAVEKERWTGIPHEVHHELPLVGECGFTGEHIACGLHVPWNLKVLGREKNRKLGSVVPIEMRALSDEDLSCLGSGDGDDEIPF